MFFKNRKIINLFEIVGINHEQGKMQENLALPIPKSLVHEKNAFSEKTAASLKKIFVVFQI